MNRTGRLLGTRTHALLGAMVLLAVTSSSVAAADDGPGPLGVTAEAAATARFARVGALFGADRAGSLAGGHFCTAAVVHSAGHDLIATAAHCLDRSGDLVFVPGYRDGKAPYGVWRVTERYTADGWATGQDEDSDVAFAVVEGGQDGQGGRAGEGAGGVEDAVGGGYGFAAGTATGSTAVTVTGYPDAGERPVTCTNRPTAHSSTQQRIECPGFTGGTSGSPWANGDGRIVGVLGGHEQGGVTDDVSYSVVLGGEAGALYRRVAGLG
ncbi:trypsin-like peptidase domain-containing protein [Streptomyces sp. NPDC047000]|uniref:trypsin-like serine peptidase n=1 Tax=Streptomyces sp. NPDC047000 TaxID=3155474 RepID=UPI0033EFCCE2